MSFWGGDVVIVREEAEIAGTLDADQKLEGLPFTEEMRVFCGMPLRVLYRAHKTCVDSTGLRRMHNTVVLDNVFCDGSWHAGCDRMCLLFWKDAWLQPAPSDAQPVIPEPPVGPVAVHEPAGGAPSRWMCQSTELFGATTPLHWSDWRQYVADFRQNSTSRMLKTMAILVTNKTRRAFHLPESRQLSGPGCPPPDRPLGLEPGELVELKSAREIMQTLDADGKHRGMAFFPEMRSMCGKRYRVLKRAERLITETTGEFRTLRNTVLLEGAVCDGTSHRACPRACQCLVRECWLRRVTK